MASYSDGLGHAPWLWWSFNNSGIFSKIKSLVSIKQEYSCMLRPSTESTHTSVTSCSVYMAQNVHICHKIWEMYKEINATYMQPWNKNGWCPVVVMQLHVFETTGSSVWFCSPMYRNGYWHTARLGPQHCRVPWELPRAWCELGYHRVRSYMCVTFTCSFVCVQEVYIC